jgi:hypothetical protein
MSRRLKTFVTNLGFFELAIAAPSMKSALEAWGMRHNAFQHGFAKQTDDPKIIAATMASPGTVLKRAVGSKGEFKEHAELPTSLLGLMPPKIERPARKLKKASRPAAHPKAQPATILSFEKARAKREKDRAKEEARIEEERGERRRATDTAEAAFEEGRRQHERTMAAIESEREKLDKRADRETKRWEAQNKKLAGAIERARK